MKRVFTSKQARKQAEDDIISNMRVIQKRLDDHRARDEEDVDKVQVMSVLTKFLALKKISKIQ